MLGCMTDGARYGFLKTTYTMLGASLGNTLLMLLSALGIGLLISETQFLFNVIKWIGAAYLIYLGIMLCLAPPSSVSGERNSHNNHLFLKGFLISVTNPKGLIYFGAFFPQFINPQHSILSQLSLMTLIFLALDFVWMSIYAVAGKQIMQWLATPIHRRWFNCASGLLLMGAGGALGFTQL